MMGPSKHIEKKELLLCCVIVLLTLAQNQVSGAVNLQLDTESTTCAEGIEIVDQRVCPQQGFVCMTDTGILFWETSIATTPPNTLYQTGAMLNVPSTLESSVDGTELFVTILTANDSLGNLTSTLTITDSYNIATATVICRDHGLPSDTDDNTESGMLQVVTSVPSPPDIMYNISGASCTLPGTANVTVSWQCPVNTGATVITGFPVSVNGTGVTTASGTDNSFLISGLALGETHDIAVAASNCLGTGADSQVQVALPDTPFSPVNLAVVLSSCDQLTVTWQNDPRNGDLPCPLYSVIAFDYTINGGGSQSLTPSVSDMTQTIDIFDNIGTYDVTVSYVNGLGSGGDSMSLSVSRVRSVHFIDGSNTIQVRLDNSCTGDFRVIVNYGLSSGGLDMNSSCVGFVMDLAQVPLPNLMARQSYSYTYLLYRGGACDGTVLDRSVLMMFTPLQGCSCEGLVTSDTVTITPNRTEYLNEAVVTYGCSGSDEINGPETRTCRNGVWDPSLSVETSCSSCSRDTLNVGNSVMISPDRSSYENNAQVTLTCESGSISGPDTKTCEGGTFGPSERTTCKKSNTGAIVGGVVGGIGGALLLVVLVVVCFCYQKNKNKGSRKPSDVRELHERTRSDDGQPDVEIAAVGETAPMYAGPSAIDRQEYPGTHDAYTVVDKTKKTHKPEDHLPTYQTPDDIKRQPAPATGEMYTITEPKKGSKKKKEATPPQKSDEELRQMYSQVDMGKKHQPPSGLVYSDISLPPSAYTDIRPH